MVVVGSTAGGVASAGGAGASYGVGFLGGASDQVGMGRGSGGGAWGAGAAGGAGAGVNVGVGIAGYVCIGRGGASYDTGALTGVSSRGTGGTNGAGAAGGCGGGGAGTASLGTNEAASGISRPLARVASSACAATARSGARRAAAISRKAPCARSAAGPIAPLAIERMVTTRPGGTLGGAGAPAGSTPNAAHTAMPEDRTSARRSLCEGAPRTAAAGCPASLTSPFPVIRIADAPNPPIAMPASCSAATPDSTAAPSAAAAGGVSGPRDRSVESGVPSFGSTATQMPLGSVPHARTGESAGCR